MQKMVTGLGSQMRVLVASVRRPSDMATLAAQAPAPPCWECHVPSTSFPCRAVCQAWTNSDNGVTCCDLTFDVLLAWHGLLVVMRQYLNRHWLTCVQQTPNSLQALRAAEAQELGGPPSGAAACRRAGLRHIHDLAGLRARAVPGAADDPGGRRLRAGRSRAGRHVRGLRKSVLVRAVSGLLELRARGSLERVGIFCLHSLSN